MTDSGMGPREAALIAVRHMAFDWYCPRDASRIRRDCPECIAAVALDAYESVRLIDLIDRYAGYSTDPEIPDCACGHPAAMHQNPNGDDPACDAADCPCDWWYEGRNDL